ncbi:MAG TPA: UdgX family uracil-DNA binding protein [Dongiaceae bacterium]|jgi:DNA polymerase|nr:UdgX family uracil-DNA binding protein [Dongiaceae bacterium]
MPKHAAQRQMARTPDPEEELAALRTEAASCRACPLWRGATQTVFGEGPVGATLMLVGEQPGDQEDRIGRPFVGPAGLLLRRALAEVGIDPDRQYVTNAVKHFKYLQRGKRRIHQKPNVGEIDICRQRWLFREIELMRPRLVVALGATAARALAGSPVAIGKSRGRVLRQETPAPVFVTVHPSAVIRIVDERDRRAAYRQFASDLAAAKKLAKGAKG